ncbi:MAG: hypothetical protein J6J13_03880 [Clostridia bacterium]|nr:hypothetical protein [Clostridia bacterium]
MQNNEQYSLSIKNSTEDLLDLYDSGEISREELLAGISNPKAERPIDIANLGEEDAKLPKLKRKQGKSDGDSESKTYESLLESDIFDQRFKDEVKTDTFIEKYKSVTNKETLKTAAEELDAGGRKYVELWWSLDSQHASLIDTAVGFILMDRYQRIGDYESAIAAAEKVREMGTAAGQQIQSIVDDINESDKY